MSTLSAATYIVGYLTAIAAFAFFLLEDIFKKPDTARKVAHWFFVFAVTLQSFGVLCDWLMHK